MSRESALGYLSGLEHFRPNENGFTVTPAEVHGLEMAAGVGYAVLECAAALRDMAATAEGQLLATVLTTRCIPLDAQEEQQLENRLRSHLGLGDR